MKKGIKKIFLIYLLVFLSTSLHAMDFSSYLEEFANLNDDLQSNSPGKKHLAKLRIKRKSISLIIDLISNSGKYIIKNSYKIMLNNCIAYKPLNVSPMNVSSMNYLSLLMYDKFLPKEKLSYLNTPIKIAKVTAGIGAVGYFAYEKSIPFTCGAFLFTIHNLFEDSINKKIESWSSLANSYYKNAFDNNIAPWVKNKMNLLLK
jgi:hypothetical protein